MKKLFQFPEGVKYNLQRKFICTFFILISFFFFIGLNQILYAENIEKTEEIEKMELKKSFAEGVIYEADNIEYLREQGMIIGKGNVVIKYADITITADEVKIDIKGKKAYAEGRAFLVQGDKTFSGEHIVYDFGAGQGIIDNIEVFVHPWNIKGKKIEKKTNKEIVVTEAFMTTCDLENPHWKIAAKKIIIFFEDKIIAKNVVVYIGKVPVFYWPRYVESLKDKRGKFVFVPGNNSDWGVYLFSGYKYYFNKDNIGVFKVDWRQKKGTAFGYDHEYKYEKAEGVVRTYYLNERDRDSHPITEKERYRIKWTHKQDFTENIWGVSEWQELSDEDIIKDYVKKEYEQDPEPESYLYLQRKFEQANINLYTNKQTNSFFDTIEYQPEINLFINKLNIGKLPLYFNSDWTATNLNKEYILSSDSTNRIDMYQELNLLKKIGIIAIKPYVGVRQTYYSQSKYDEEELRGVFYNGISLSSKAYSTMYHYSEFWDIERLRLVYQPSIEYVYNYEPTVKNSYLNQFDGIDSITKQNYIRFKFENRLQTKRLRKNGINNWDLVKHKIYFDYHPDGIEYKGGKRDISYIYDRLEISPFEWVAIDFKSKIDAYEKDWEEFKFDFNLNRKNKGKLGLGYHYRKDNNSDALVDVSVKLGKKWRAKVVNNYDFENRRMSRQQYSIFRDLHCWQTAFTYVNEKDDYTSENEFWITFYLTAFQEDVFDFSEGLKGKVG
jgi:lipopolysaccharide assembly outer membrane protein LptD (OstA)